ncbi:prolyl oligopeptidase family serine peptidase [Shewanella sp. JM162201]|uniref:Prolyl oligopeptidase family serine peptidase n=1 Tax=Shewanella jiangmenensis TaxID=2837387 RepID=A0ABS5V1Y0_9GAMM|nr:prolyl oligopeptidase family serine peptidase [Shewanella jiangmenensis]MBT1444471.1 prolyl oligopeptidase family serine peptidase [Shewanella jiangmenensis]
MPFMLLTLLFLMSAHGAELSRPDKPDAFANSTFMKQAASVSASTPAPQMPDGYQLPPTAYVQMVDASKDTKVQLSPDSKWLLLANQRANASLNELARPLMKLGGSEIDTLTDLPKDPGPIYQSLKLISSDGKRSIAVAGIGQLMPYIAPRFSPDSQSLSLISLASERPVLHFIDIPKGAIQAVPAARLNFSLGVNYAWLPDSSAVVAGIDTSAPKISSVLPPPTIKESTPAQGSRRTHANLLKNPLDASLFEAQIMATPSLIDRHGKVTALTEPSALKDISPSPDGAHLLIVSLDKPYSLRVGYRGFPKRVQVISLKDSTLKFEQHLAGADNENEDDDNPAPKPRLWQWSPKGELVWAQSHEFTDDKGKTRWRDRIWTLAPPFDTEPVQLTEVKWPIIDLDWRDDNGILITQKKRSVQEVRVSLYLPASDSAAADTLVIDAQINKQPSQSNNQQAQSDANPGLKDWYQISSRDTYQRPGTLHRVRQGGTSVIATRDGTMIHYGEGHSDDGMRPFVRQSAPGADSKTLWQSPLDALEQVEAILALEPLTLLVKRETPHEPPALYLVRPNQHQRKHESQNQTQTQTQTQTQAQAQTQSESESRQLIAPLARRQLLAENSSRELIRFERADGQKLSGTLHLPPGYKKSDGPLPVLIWAYPREYNSTDVAAQISHSPLEYPGISPLSAQAMLAGGIAVFDKVSMPIIGSKDNPANDSFLPQLIANAEAAVKVLVERGIAAPDKIAIGGHSYGAFMTVNLLAHTDLFAAGIARSGAYNRSLTPFGFQNERRNYWQAQQLYQGMSPFNYADKIRAPLLLIHGEADTNPGTNPIQSARLFDAVSSLGGQVRLVNLPFEGHSYKARESLLHLLWEQDNWLKTHLSGQQKPLTSVEKDTIKH